MTERQVEIGNKFLNYLADKGQANVDDYFYHLTEESGYNSIDDQVQIGSVKSHLIRFRLIESLGRGNYFFSLTIEGQKANEVGIKKWMATQQKEKTSINANNVVFVEGGMVGDIYQESEINTKAELIPDLESAHQKTKLTKGEIWSIIIAVLGLISATAIGVIQILN